MNTNTRTVTPEELLRHSGFLAGLVRTLVFDQERAEDYLQETWAYALARPPLAGPGLKAWLATVARNFIRQDRRARDRRLRREIAVARPECEPSSDEVVARERARRRVVDAVFELAEPYRSVVVLRYLEDLPPREIAKRLDAPVETVRTRLKRAAAMLRDKLDQQAGGDRRVWCVALLPLLHERRTAVAAAGAAGVLGGVAAMSLKTKIAVTAVLLALLLGAGAFLYPWSPGGYGAPPEPAEGPVLADAGPPEEVAEPPAAEPAVPPSGEAAVEPPAAPRSRVTLRFTDGAGRALTADEVLRRYADAGMELAVTAVPESVFSGRDIADFVRTRIEPVEAWTATIPLVRDGEDLRLAEAVPEGNHRLYMGRPGAAPLLASGLSEDAAGLTVPLPEAPRRGRVRLLDAEGRSPLAKAVVRPYYEFGDDMLFLPGPALVADHLGEVDIPLLEDAVRGESRQPTWWAETDGHLGRIPVQGVRMAGPGRVLDVEVLPFATVTGKAYLSSGEAAAGRVVFWQQKGRVARAVVQADGSFELSPIAVEEPEGESVEIVLVEDLGSFKLAMARADVVPGGAGEARIGAPAGERTTAVLRGRITAGGKPVAGAFVTSRTEGGERSEGFVRTGEDGTFVKDDVAAGPVRYTIFFGDPRAVDDFRVRNLEPVDLSVGSEHRVEFDLPAGVFTVKVVDASTGAPISGAVAWGRPEDREAGQDRFEGHLYYPGWGLRTAEDGAARLPAMLPGEPHRVGAKADGYRGVTLEGQLPGTAERPAEVVIRLEKQE